MQTENPTTFAHPLHTHNPSTPNSTTTMTNTHSKLVPKKRTATQVCILFFRTLKKMPSVKKKIR